MVQENPSQAAEAVLVQLRRILRAVHIHSRRLIRDFGLTSPQLLILREVERQQDPTLGKVATAVSLAPRHPYRDHPSSGKPGALDP